MITNADVNKYCFVRFAYGHDQFTWENMGTTIFHVSTEDNKVTIRFRSGELRTIELEDVRVIEPHSNVH